MISRRAAILALLLWSVAAAAQQGAAGDPWGEDWGDDPWAEEETGLVWTGFVEGGVGDRLDSFGPTDYTLGEGRLRLETEHYWRDIEFSLKGDLGYDEVADDEISAFRELAVAFGVGRHVEVKAGRQVLTWGTGDLVFLNDLFPKDFVSFFVGRDDEYLKAPSDALKVSGYMPWFNVDLVWMPKFEPDDYITGERLSFFSPQAGRVVAPAARVRADTPDDDEFALRLFKTIGGVEFAAYGYDGYFKQPTAIRPDGELTFAALRAYGASVRGNLGPGLANAEVSWHRSLDDRDGDNPRIPNSQFLALVGYDWELFANFNVGLQYNLEWTRHHDALIDASPAPDLAPAERRRVFTNRLTYRLMRDRLTLSLFTFYSPTDDDAYFRPYVNYRHSDAWQLAVGANLFTGRREHTFFGQLQDNSNIYTRLRRYF